MKHCPFVIDGPRYQQHIGRNSNRAVVAGSPYALHTMQDWECTIDPNAPDFFMLPCVSFQAKLRYQRLNRSRILMKDAYGRQWSVFLSEADQVLPAMQLGCLTAWWTMAKRGKAYGLAVDLSRPLLAQVPQDQDVPLMLEKAMHLHDVVPLFEAMAV